MKDNKNKRLQPSYFTIRDRLTEEMKKLLDKVATTTKSKKTKFFPKNKSKQNNNNKNTL